MKNPITKYAAAAIIIIVALTGIYHFTGSIDGITPAYAMCDLPKLYKAASSMHFKGIIYNDNGSEVVERPFEYWIDLNNARIRKTDTGLITNGTETTVTELEDIFNGNELVHVNHTDKTVKYEYASEFYKNYFLKQNFDTILKQTINIIMDIGDFAYIGNEIVGNTECEIWDGQYTHPAQDVTIKITCWLDPLTGNLYRMKMWYKTGTKDFKLGMELLEAERNIEINDAFFVFEPIQGYEYQNTRETAAKARMPYVSSFYSNNVGLTLYTSFKLVNGSMILCWKCVDSNTERRDDIFSRTIFGGQIPETAVSITGLQGLAVNGLGPVYHGKHLANIKFENNFCEWSIYLPENNDYKNVMAYSAIQAVNDENIKDKWKCNLTFTAGLNIDNQQDFEKLVLGAMAELSEDGEIPPELTYENILKLADKKNTE